jgi:hypothetical protein
VTSSRSQALRRSKARIDQRLASRAWEGGERPTFTRTPLKFEVAHRDRAVSSGGIGVIHELAKQVGLFENIERRVRVLRAHKPYHESDHVLNFAYSALCGGQTIEDLELLRKNGAYLDLLGAQRIPDPTTAGDFCRRFTPDAVAELQAAIGESRLRVWAKQSPAFFAKATIDFDGTYVATEGECKEGVDINYKGEWSYHPLVASLANTREPLEIENRRGNRPSHEGAAEMADRQIAFVRKAGFRSVLLRGDTAFSQSQHLDRWHADGVEFVFGYAASTALVMQAAGLPKSVWRLLERKNREAGSGPKRAPRTNHREAIVEERGYKNLRLECEEVAEMRYRPTACAREYRMVVLKKTIDVTCGQLQLEPDTEFYFYITNIEEDSPTAIVRQANQRCNQENLLAQLKGGVHSLRAPLNTLVANWAYMVMTSIAWSLKAWLALVLPTKGRWGERHEEERDRVLKMEFRTFLNWMIRIPAQVLRTGRRTIVRFLGWSPLLGALLRGSDVVRVMRF